MTLNLSVVDIKSLMMNTFVRKYKTKDIHLDLMLNVLFDL